MAMYSVLQESQDNWYLVYWIMVDRVVLSSTLHMAFDALLLRIVLHFWGWVQTLG